MGENRLYKNIPSIIRKGNPAVSGSETDCCTSAVEHIPQKSVQTVEAHKTGCLVCGAELVYFETNQNFSCYYCGQTMPANARCIHGHFVCDHCHSADALEIIRNVCLHSQQTDMVALMRTIRSHPDFRMHGPEHHSVTPAVILTALRNSGYPVSDEQITTAIQRGHTLVGGSCAFLGVCGAAVGVGIAVSVALEANPYEGRKRQMAQQATSRALERISSLAAPRCCQREVWLALNEASVLMQEYTGKRLPAPWFKCEQFLQNKECIHAQCPLWPTNQEEGRGGDGQVDIWR